MSLRRRNTFPALLSFPLLAGTYESMAGAPAATLGCKLAWGKCWGENPEKSSHTLDTLAWMVTCRLYETKRETSTYFIWAKLLWVFF